MAYNVYFSCDCCGDGYNWTNHMVSLSMATRIAREKGWQVGKNGWYCPKCREKKKAGKLWEK